MVLYRRHNGIALEDKLLDEPKQAFERQLFIPVCGGVTFFSIQTGNFQTGSIQTTGKAKTFFIDNWYSAFAARRTLLQPFPLQTQSKSRPDNGRCRIRKRSTRIISPRQDKKNPLQNRNEGFKQHQRIESNLRIKTKNNPGPKQCR